jgi:flagellin-like protein
MKEVVRIVHKKVWSLHREQDEAVSPVIATILMVAITVVLATAVYFLVSYYTLPSPLYGSLNVESPSGQMNSTTLLLSLASPTSLKNPSDITMTIINSTSTGVGWTVQNVTITSGSSVFYMNTFTSSGDFWTSSGAIPTHGSTSVGSNALITITFHSSSGKPVDLSGMKLLISYAGYTGSIQLNNLSS